MRKLAFCACGCGARVRAALPPRAMRLRKRLHAEIQERKAAEHREAVINAVREHILGLQPAQLAAPAQETMH